MMDAAAAILIADRIAHAHLTAVYDAVQRGEQDFAPSFMRIAESLLEDAGLDDADRLIVLETADRRLRLFYTRAARVF